MITITIPEKLIKGDDLMIIQRREYEALQKHLLEVRDALVKIRKGEFEFKRGKTRIVESLSELRS